MKKVKDLTQDDIRELITYDPVTGKAYWNKRDVKWFRDGKFTADHCANLWNSRFAEKEITNTHNFGYYRPKLLDRMEYLHRIIWFYMTGEWPDVIDHINGNVRDNRWCNLRSVSQSLNCRNRALQSNNTSGFHGIHKCKANNKWQVYINNFENEHLFLGYYESIEEAIVLRKEAEIKYGYSSTHGRGI